MMYRYKLFVYLYLLSSFILSQKVCEDKPCRNIRDLENKKINCEQLTNNKYDNDRKEICSRKDGKGNKCCLLTCGSCKSETLSPLQPSLKSFIPSDKSSLIMCKDDTKKDVFQKNGDVYSCKKLQKVKKDRRQKYCRNEKNARKLCPLTCGKCELKFPSLTPTSSPVGNKPDKPLKKNVLYFIIDDLRPQLNKAYGQEYMITPNIDKLSESALTFRHAYSQESLCLPSRSSFMTGRRSYHTKVKSINKSFRKGGKDASGKLGEDWITMPQHFKKNGYVTLGAGKIFHPEEKKEKTSWSQDKEYFPYYQMWINSTKYAGPCPDKTGFGSWYDIGKWYDKSEKDCESLNDNRTSFEEGYCNRLDGLMEPNPSSTWCVLDEPNENFYDHGVASKLIKNLEYASNTNKPFFLMGGFIRPHLPFRIPKRIWDMYENKNLPLPRNPLPPKYSPGTAWREAEFYDSLSGDIYGTTNMSTSMDDARQYDLRRAYYASVTWIDEQVGRVLDTLDALNLTNDTVVIFHGDHGYHLGEQNRWKKMANSEIATRVPLIIRAPWMADSINKTTNIIAELVDVYSTLADLAGTGIPTDKLDGTSLVPVFNNTDILTLSTVNEKLNIPEKVAYSETNSDINFKKCEIFRAPNDGGCTTGNKLLNKIAWSGYTTRSQGWRYMVWVPRGPDQNLTPNSDFARNIKLDNWDSQYLLEELYDYRNDTGMDLEYKDQITNLVNDERYKKERDIMHAMTKKHFYELRFQHEITWFLGKKNWSCIKTCETVSKHMNKRFDCNLRELRSVTSEQTLINAARSAGVKLLKKNNNIKNDNKKDTSPFIDKDGNGIYSKKMIATCEAQKRNGQRLCPCSGNPNVMTSKIK